ncbi:MAG: phosphatase PAP2 family protein [Muribaculaceae bacterium]|nr:phosphatase PAP2 family protein [Muribaculaceae bacterium]
MKTRLLTLILILLLALPHTALAGEPQIELTRSQKGVRTSTDVLLVAMPVATLGIAIGKKDWKGIGIGVAEAAGTMAVTYGLKYAIHKRRPDGSDNHSFPSGHSSLVFTDASFVMRRYGWKFGVPAYALAGYVAWGRVYGKKHDTWDVLAGAAIGSAIGLLCTKPFMKNAQIAPAALTDPQTGQFISIGIGGTVNF